MVERSIVYSEPTEFAGKDRAPRVALIRGTGSTKNQAVSPAEQCWLQWYKLNIWGYTRFNGAAINYDGAGRNASDNNTVYLLGRFIF